MGQAPRKFLNFGSYTKGTNVGAVDEYDVLVVLDSASGRFTDDNGGVIGVGLGTASPNHKYNTRFYKDGTTHVSPIRILNWLKGVVEEVVTPIGGTAPIRNGEAITAHVSSSKVDVDLVPAGIFYSEENNTMFYSIPKGDINGNWILTAPDWDTAALNAVAEGKTNFRNVIRIAKRVKGTYSIPISSFAIETAIVGWVAQNAWLNVLASDLHRVFMALHDILKSGWISDPYQPSMNLLQDVSNLERLAGIYSGLAASLLAQCFSTSQINLPQHIYRLLENK